MTFHPHLYPLPSFSIFSPLMEELHPPKSPLIRWDLKRLGAGVRLFNHKEEFLSIKKLSELDFDILLPNDRRMVKSRGNEMLKKFCQKKQ